MDIGEESEPYVIEPIEDPVPGRRTAPPPEPELPAVAPDRDRTREPDLVPA